MVAIGPTERKDVHCKIYVEESVAKAIAKFQDENGLSSFSEAGRRLLLDGLKANSV